jgi:hypothetical protein
LTIGICIRELEKNFGHTIESITAQEIFNAHANLDEEVEFLLANGSGEQSASTVQLIQPISFP